MSKTKAKRQKKINDRKRRREEQRTHNQKEWDRGRIMKEDKDGRKRYSPEYTTQLAIRLRDNIIEALNKTSGEENGRKQFLHYYFQLKPYIRDLLIFWNSDVENLYTYNFLKKGLEIYWDLGDERREELRDNLLKIWEH